MEDVFYLEAAGSETIGRFRSRESEWTFGRWEICWPWVEHCGFVKIHLAFAAPHPATG